MRLSLAAIAAVLILSIVVPFTGNSEQPQSEKKATVRTNPDVVSAFRLSLEEEVQNQIGMPIEGYVPNMFLQLFPGLLESDFEGAAASIGFYTIENGRLVHKFDETQFIHSAAAALTFFGMGTVLDHIATRINVDLTAEGALDNIMNALTSE